MTSLYALAADRGNPKVAHLYNASHPAVLQLIRHVIDAAHENGIPCGICGEAGSDPALQQIFVRMGIDELFMFPASILKIPLRNFQDVYGADAGILIPGEACSNAGPQPAQQFKIHTGIRR